MLVAHFAVPLAGAVLVAINTRLSTEEIRYILDHSGCRLLVVDAALFPMVAPVAGELKTVEEIITVIDPVNPGDGTGSGVTYDDLLARGHDDDLPWTVDDEEGTISINYTSGTTGRPKGVMYHHRGAHLNSYGEIVHSFAHPGQRLPVDAADVPLQRLVHARGRSRRSAARTCACARCAAT